MKRAKKILITYLVIIFSAIHNLSIRAEVEKYNDWELPFRQIIEAQKTAPPEKAIAALGDIVGKLAKDGEPELKESGVFQMAKAKLINIPGHADFLGREIRRLADAEYNHTSEVASNDRRWFLHILGQLPSVETVKVLGELLYDERDPTNGSPSDSPYVPNSVAAAYGLRELNLRDSPPEAEGGARQEVVAWQVWYESIRAGKRTFSFRGVDTIYTINGPVGAIAPPKAKREEKREFSIDKSNTQNPLLFVSIILLVMLIFAATFLWLKQKKR